MCSIKNFKGPGAKPEPYVLVNPKPETGPGP